jgi:hypothetical protein
LLRPDGPFSTLSLCIGFILTGISGTDEGGFSFSGIIGWQHKCVEYWEARVKSSLEA